MSGVGCCTRSRRSNGGLGAKWPGVRDGGQSLACWGSLMAHAAHRIARVSLVPRTTGRDVILTPAEVADWLKCSPRQVLRLPIPRLMAGKKKLARFTERSVQSWIDAQLRGAR